MDLFVTQPPINYSLIQKPLDAKNDSSHAIIIKRLFAIFQIIPILPSLDFVFFKWLNHALSPLYILLNYIDFHGIVSTAVQFWYTACLSEENIWPFKIILFYE